MSSQFVAVDQWIFNLLTRRADELPGRWKRWLAMYYPDARIRKLFWQKTGVEIGEDSFMNPGVVVVDDYQSADCLLSLGARVSVSPGVVFAAYSSPNNSPAMQQHPYIRERLIRRERIIVEDDVWIGANATILAGVRVGRGAIIGAGSVVISDVPSFTVTAGVPAKVIRTLEPF